MNNPAEQIPENTNVGLPEKIEPVGAPPAPATTDQAALSPLALLDRAIVAGASPETLEKLFELYRGAEAYTAQKAYNAAIAEARAEIKPITRNRRVNFESSRGGRATDYTHETLDEISRMVDPILGKYGLSYRFRTEQPENSDQIRVICVVSHKDGYFEENSLKGPPDATGNKNPLQQIGSTQTYLQRYTLKGALGLAASYDDDGAEVGENVIDDDRRAVLEGLLESAVNTSREKVFKYFGIEKGGFTALRPDQYDACYQELMLRQPEKGKKGNDSSTK